MKGWKRDEYFDWITLCNRSNCLSSSCIGGNGGAFGGGALEASLGADAGNVLIKATAVLGAIFLLNTLVLARLTSTPTSGSVVAGEENAAPQAEAPVLPSQDAQPPVAPANSAK